MPKIWKGFEKIFSQLRQRQGFLSPVISKRGNQRFSPTGSASQDIALNFWSDSKLASHVLIITLIHVGRRRQELNPISLRRSYNANHFCCYIKLLRQAVAYSLLAACSLCHLAQIVCCKTLVVPGRFFSAGSAR